MHTKLLNLVVGAVFLSFAGCATGVRVGGPNREVAAGAAVGPVVAPAPVYVETPPPR
jgi:hypothetical protein